LVAVDREINYRIADIITNLNKYSELDMKDYEVAILVAVVINGDPVDSTETNFVVDVIEILMIFVLIRSVDICQIN
jgi:hypothetical protein